MNVEVIQLSDDWDGIGEVGDRLGTVSSDKEVKPFIEWYLKTYINPDTVVESWSDGEDDFYGDTIIANIQINGGYSTSLEFVTPPFDNEIDPHLKGVDKTVNP